MAVPSLLPPSSELCPKGPCLFHFLCAWCLQCWLSVATCSLPKPLSPAQTRAVSPGPRTLSSPGPRTLSPQAQGYPARRQPCQWTLCSLLTGFSNFQRVLPYLSSTHRRPLRPAPFTPGRVSAETLCGLKWSVRTALQWTHRHLGNQEKPINEGPPLCNDKNLGFSTLQA